MTDLEHITALLAEMNLRYQQRFDAQTTAINAALLAAEKAVSKAEIAAERRFELLNELRAGVATVGQVDALEKRINELAARIDQTEGRSTGLSTGWAFLVGAAVLVGAVITAFINIR